jgi:manganese/zinc/iron transport system permease protein
MGGITFAALAVVAVFWKEFKLVTFDPVFARTLGLPVLALEIALTVMIALAVVVGLQMVGVVLMAAMVIAPAVAARQWSSRLEVMVILSALIGMASGVFGALVSALGRGLATGPLIVLAASAAVAVSLLFAPGRGVVWEMRRRAANRRSLRGQRVLTTLYRLAAHHGDSAYPSEQGMVDAYYGIATAPVMRRLQDRGLIQPVAHAPEPTPHWVLTPEGIAEAERILSQPRRAGGLTMLAALFDNPSAMIMLTGALVGIAASLLGTFLVLRGNSMLSDAISHSIVFGIVIVWMLTGQQSGPVQIIGAALTGVFTVFLTELLVTTRRVKNDAAIGLVFPVLFSIGVLLLNVYARNVHIDQHTVLLGEIGFVWLDTVEIGGYPVPQALLSMGAMTLVNLAFVTFFFKELKLATFDEALARALGFAPAALSYALLALTSATAVAAFDSVGAILFIAFVIVPPSAAYLLTDRLWLMLVYGSAISVVSSITGYGLAITLNVSIGGMMAVMTGVILVLAFLFGPRYGMIAQVSRRRGRQRANECRTLAVHLFNHEGGPAQDEENVAAALQGHLKWDEIHARHVLRQCLDQGLVTRDGEALALTDKGRVEARAILEPWRQEGA